MKKNNGFKNPITQQIGKLATKNEPQGIIETIEKQDQNNLPATDLSTNIEDNFTRIQGTFSNCYDIVLRRFTLGENQKKCFIAYIENLVKKEDISQDILDPLMSGSKNKNNQGAANQENEIEKIKKQLITIAEISDINTLKDAISQILLGFSVLFVDGVPTALALSTKGWEYRQVADPKTESIVRGPMVGFIEEISINTSLLRRIIKTPKLKMERFIIGTLSQTEVVVSYIEGIADAGILSEIRERLNRIDTDVIIDSGFLEGFIEDNPFSIFPQITNTERPDTSAAALAEGRFVILVDGTPFVLIVPTTFSYFLVAAEDYYDRFYFATFVRMLRYFAFALALFGPAVYIGITTFHPEMIPTSLFISIAVSRADVPFPALAEAMLMEVTFELMREASARLPTIIGQSLSIVGALVIGQTAVQAGLVSSALIIVVAVTGIASFSIPKFHIARAVRLLRFPMMLLAATMGLYGIIMGVLMLMIHMASIRSFGVPFLSPLAPINIEGWKDVFIRFPFWAMNKRPVFIQQNNVTRTKKDLMPKPPTKN